MDTKRFAKLVSTVFNPFLLGLAFLPTLMLETMSLNARSLVLTTTYVTLTVFIPSLILKHLIKTGKVTDKDITIKEERKIFFKAASPSFAAAFFILLLAKTPKLLLLSGVGIMVLILIYSLISPIYKISAHVGVPAFIISTLGLTANKNFFLLSPLLLLISWSRYKLGKHTVTQCLLGAGVGGGIPAVILKLLA